MAIGCFCCACNLLVSEDPPLEPTVMAQDDYAWDNIALAIQYEFIDVPRIDCPKIESYLSGSGKCLPKKLPFTTGYECPLKYPAKSLFFSCNITNNEPAIYARLAWDDTLRDIDFGMSLGPCQLEAAGPAIGEKPRFKTDTGYKVCLLENAKAKGTLKGEPDKRRPAGVFFDLSNNTESVDNLKKQAELKFFNAPADLVIDARLLDENDQIAALEDVFAIFSFYRKMNVPAEMH